MTIHADTEWEIRTTGANTNGGGFYDSNPGTSVDYSQQAAAELAVADAASDGAGTGISSATGGFTAAMEGNCMFLTGSSFTEGWYQIVTYTDTNNVTIDRSAGANQSGGTCNVGGAWDLADATRDALFFVGVNKADYNTVWWKTGTYTVAYNLIIAANYLHIFGYDTTHGDNPEGVNRPYVDLGSGSHYYMYCLASASYLMLMNFSISSRDSVSSSATLLISGATSLLVNVKAERLNYNTEAVTISGDNASLIQCHAVADIGDGFKVNGPDRVNFQCCHADVAGDGFTYSGTCYGTTIDGCIAANCETGFKISQYGHVHNCTAYNCSSYGIDAFSGGHLANNIVSECGVGMRGNYATKAVRNCMYNNSTDYSGFNSHGFGDILSDPLMVDPANDDFTLDAGSPCFNTGLKLGTAVGL